MLFLWGLVIILIEKRNIKNENTRETMSYRTALMIGIAQCFAMVPGTSRSAATIIGAMLLGLSRVESAEFSFFLAIPTMLGATSLKVVKLIINKTPITSFQVMLIILGMVLSFIFALIVIRKFMDYVKNHDFVVFGVYRMILSIVVLAYFLMK